jgi:hypothetical protein
MDMSKKQAEFFATLILICTITAVLVLAIDYQIKGAILEQSNKLRLDMERFLNGQSAAATGSHRSSNHSDNHVSYPSDLVDSGDARLETTGHNEASNGTGDPTKIRTAKPRGTTRRSPISDED